jgi:class 3 adenylate cyclase/tetratricopeptide (TPR) repeat protein
MSEREQLEKSIEDLEKQRLVLGDDVIDAALKPLKESLAKLSAGEGEEELTQPSERRVVTILFCDVTGSTALSEQMDPEEWTGIMNATFKHLNESIARYDGTVARLMGDAILAFFGAPVAHEDDPERAVLAGLQILESIAPLRARLKSEKALDFNVRVGINTGLVVVGEVGSDIRGEYTAMGDAVNLAARMEQTAAPGTIQISKDTYQNVSKLVEFEPLGKIKVKGKNQPLKTYRVLSSKSEIPRRRGLDDMGLSSPVVGRDTEMKRLKKSLYRLRERGEGGLVLIYGEAGIGKTRIKDELKLDAEEGFNWLEGSSVAYSQNLSFWPFQEILRDFADITEEDEEKAAWSKLESSIIRLHGEKADEILPYLASLLGLQIREPFLEKVQYLEAEDLGRQVYLASPRFFEKLAKEKPLLLVFEDLHWMDDASARLLEHLLELINRAPILIIGLSRPEPGSAGEQLGEVARQKFAQSFIEVRLSALPEDASRTIVDNLLEVAELPGALQKNILNRAGGNPFFLEEIVRTLIEVGAVVQDPGSGRWHASEKSDTLRLPDTIQGVVMARVDRLAEEVKGILRTASVIGRSFLYRVLQVVTGSERNLEQNLGVLMEVDLIREKQYSRELEYIFKHSLAQETVYESILLETRRRLHKQVAQTIEKLFAERIDEFFGLLAFHYARAEVWQKALDYLLKAGDKAGQLAADGEALVHYRQAMSAYERAFGEQWNPLQRATLERKIGQALFRRGEHEQALNHLKHALSLLGQPLPESTWGVRWGILVEIAKQFLLRLVPQLLKKAGGPDKYLDDVERVEAYGSLLWIDLGSKPERFFLDALLSVNLAERINLKEQTVFGFTFLGGALVFAGYYGLAERYAQYAFAVAKTVENPGILGDVYHVQAVTASWQGQPEKAVEIGREAIRLLWETGAIHDWGNANLVVSEANVHLGRYGAVHRVADEMINVGQDGGDLQVLGWGYSLRGLVERYIGDPEASIAAYQQFVEIASPIPDYVSQVEGKAMIAHNCLLLNQVETALASLNEAERIFREQKVRGNRFLGKIRIGFAWAYLMAAEDASGLERKECLARAARECKGARKSVRRFNRHAAEAYRLQGTCDWLYGRERRARRWWGKSLALAENGQPYELAMTYLEMGKRLDEKTYLVKGKEVLAEIGAWTDDE